MCFQRLHIAVGVSIRHTHDMAQRLAPIFELSTTVQTVLSVMEGSTTTKWYQNKLMQETSFSRPTIRAALDEIHDRKMVTKNVFGRPAPDIYELTPTALAALRLFKRST